MIFYRLKQNKYALGIIGFLAFVFFAPFRILRKLRINKEGGTVLISFHLLGDTVFTLPTVKYFSEKYGKNFTIFCYANSKIIYEKAGLKARFVVFQKSDFLFEGRLPSKNIRRKLSLEKPFRIIDITGGIHSAFTIAGIGAAEIIGMNEEIYKTLYDKFIPLRRTPHLIDKYFDVAKIFDGDLDRKKYSYLPQKINGGNRILFHPFGSWKEKEWEFEKFTALAKKLNEEGYDTAFIWEKERNEETKRDLLENKNIRPIETANLEELFSELEKSFLLIGVDSGPIHIASLLGTSTVAIYGPTNPEFIKPERENHFTIRKVVRCSPENGKHYCDTYAGRTCKTLECLETLTVGEVFSKTIDSIKKITAS